MRLVKILPMLLLAAALAASGQSTFPSPQPTPAQKEPRSHPAEDISGMYTFLNEGEFVQFDVQGELVSGYISRMGSLDSDRGDFLDQFFDKARIEGHDVTFTTKVIHSVWFEFKGRFERASGKTKGEDGFYVIHGTLTEYTIAPDKTSSSRAREVEFKSMSQPQDVEPKKKK